MIENKSLIIKRYKIHISDSSLIFNSCKPNALVEAFQVGDIASSIALGWVEESECFDEDTPLNRDKFYTDLQLNYLFNPHERFWEVFWVAANEMAQINDFCVMTLYNSYETQKNLEKQMSKFIFNSKVDAVTVDIFHEQSYNWEKICLEHVWAFCFVQCSAFLEKTLKMLCQDLGNGTKPGKKVPNVSGIDHYLAFLRNNCCINFEENLKTQQILDTARQIRNAYAHGDINRCQQLLSKVSLREFLESITNLLYQIEAAAWIREDKRNLP